MEDSFKQFSGVFIQLQEVGVTLGLKIVVAIAIFLVGRWVAKFLRRFVKRTLGKTRIDPTVSVLELADSSVNFAVRPWVKTTDYMSLSLSLYEAFKIRFDEVGIVIPLPQRDLHMYEISRELSQ